MAPAAEHVASGQCSTISHDDGHRPQSWSDFTGHIHLTLIRNAKHFDVTGAVARTADSVRFYQKDIALPDRDIRSGSSPHQGSQRFLRNRLRGLLTRGPQPDRRLASTAQKAGNA